MYKLYNVSAVYIIHLHFKDIALLKQIQSFFCVGNIIIKKTSVSFYLNSIKDITNIIIQFFEKYPLLTQKGADFKIFKQIVNMMNNKEHITM